MKPTILAFLRSRAVGVENRASREELVAYLREWWPADQFSDSWLEREARRVIAETPEICSLQGGYYIPRDTAEARMSYDYHRKRGLSELARAARIRDAHPGVEQGVLPYG